MATTAPLPNAVKHALHDRERRPEPWIPSSPEAGGVAWSLRRGVPLLARHVVDRSRIHRMLDLSTEKKLVLVSAPAGSGKTTAVSSWLRRTAEDGARRRVEWLTFTSPLVLHSTFWARVAEQLGGQGDETALLRLIGNHPPQSNSAATAAHEGASGHLTLVLDGFEMVPPSMTQDLEAVLANSADGLQVLVLTRTDQNLPFATLRLMDELAEIRLADLALTTEEAAELLAAHGVRLDLAKAAAAELTRQTQGWAAGVRLAALRMAGRDGLDGPVDAEELSGIVADYLRAEWFDEQPSVVRDVMLQTCVPDSLTPGLLEELGGPAAAPTIKVLSRERAFVQAVPGQPHHYRYHPLMREFLRGELRRESPGRTLRLQRRTAQWHLRHGSLAEAVRICARAGDWRTACRYAATGSALSEMLTDDDGHGVISALSMLPDRVNGTCAEICRAAVALGRHDAAGCARHLGRFRAALGDDADGPLEAAADVVAAMLAVATSDPRGALETVERSTAAVSAQLVGPGREQGRLSGLLGAARGELLLVLGEFAAARRQLLAAEESNREAGALDVSAECLATLALSACLEGELVLARDWASAWVARQELDPADDVHRTLTGWVALAWVSIEELDLVRARAHLAQASSSNDGSGDPLSRTALQLVTARLRRFTGDMHGTMLALDLAQAASTVPWLLDRVTVERARVAVAEEDSAAAVGLLETCAEREPSAAPVLARARVDLGEPETAYASLPELLLQQTPESVALPVEAALVEVVDQFRRGKESRARTLLERALRLAAPASLRRPFAECAEAREILTADVELRSRSSWLGLPRTAGDTSISEPCRPVVGGAAPPQRTRSGPFIEPLTPKELEVLSYLSDLLTTEEIAAAMFVSVNTVRTHVRNILRKLAVRRRNEAVRRGRDLQLIAAS